jgi:type VI secretion system protein ImpG
MDVLFQYYQNELNYFEQIAKAFSKNYPDWAGELSDGVGDHSGVKKLIESFAFLTARTQYELDDKNDRFYQVVLNHLYPHFRSGLPAQTIVKLTPEPELAHSTIFPKGTALVVKNQVGDDCRFRTVYPVSVYPIDCHCLGYQKGVSDRGVLEREPLAQCHIQLTKANQDTPWKAYGIDRLRFYINAHLPQACQWFFLVFNHCVGLKFCSLKTGQSCTLATSTLKRIGFSPDEGSVPLVPGAHDAYRLLSEYFNFPEKFLFFECTALTAFFSQELDDTVDVFFYFDHFDTMLSVEAGRDVFTLNATPVVNLFDAPAAPIEYDQTQSAYPLLPTRDKDAELIQASQVIQLSGLARDSNTRWEFCPYLTPRFSESPPQTIAYWYKSYHQETALPFLYFIHEPGMLPPMNIDVHCLWRNTAKALQFDSNKTESMFSLWDNANPDISQIDSLTRIKLPSRTCPTGGMSTLLAHLNTNYLNLNDPKAAFKGLMSLLNAYQGSHDSSIYQVLSSLEGLCVEPSITRRAFGRQMGFCTGTRVHLKTKAAPPQWPALFLLGEVLNHFFALYSAANQFTQLTLANTNEQVIAKWKARIGTRSLL